MLHCEAGAGTAWTGRQVFPLSEQDSQQWSLPLIEEAERHLAEASSRGRAGRFQLEAAIQSVHAERARSSRNRVGSDHAVLTNSSSASLRRSGTRTGYAAAVGEANGPEAGLTVLDGMDPGDVSAISLLGGSCSPLATVRENIRVAAMLSTGSVGWPKIRP